MVWQRTLAQVEATSSQKGAKNCTNLKQAKVPNLKEGERTMIYEEFGFTDI